jgi:hypothetical protein
MAGDIELTIKGMVIIRVDLSCMSRLPFGIAVEPHRREQLCSAAKALKGRFLQLVLTALRRPEMAGRSGSSDMNSIHSS